MDFFQICTKEPRKGSEDTLPSIYPDFRVGRSKDLMVRGKSFYAIWDEEAGLWSTDEYDVVRLVDKELKEYKDKLEASTGLAYSVKYLRSFTNGGWAQFQRYLKNVSDNAHQLDQNLTFANTEVKKGDYVSRRLPYPLEGGDCSAWDELVGTLYSVEERAKIEWFIGAIVSGDAKKIQKFGVFYGPPASGKSTILQIIQKLFEGYTTTFEANALGSSSSSFSTEVFKNNPLVAIQHDANLSKIDDNARLNSIISHEEMTMHEKFKPSYTAVVFAILLMGTNQPVKISDAKSGLIRRLIDIHPTGVRIPNNHYNTLMSKIDFELGAIANHCLEVYRGMGKNYYNSYRPLEMMLQTDIFFNFIESAFDIFKAQDGTTLKQAYSLYREFCSETGIERTLPQYKFREELRNYFEEFKDRHTQEDGSVVRSYYSGFNANKFKAPVKDDVTFSLVIEETESLLDEVLKDMPAQTWREDEDGNQVPAKRWVNVTTKLADLDTRELHFVRVPESHIVVDFDLTDLNGTKSLERNLEAASHWPPTYAELSKSGKGVHLHYIYDGDVTELSNVYSEGIEVKTLLGDASLRRRLSKCNNVPVATINSGLPLKEKKVLTSTTMQSEKTVREMIAKNLRKEYNSGTKSSVDFIKKILDDAYTSGMSYDVSDMKSSVIAFAAGSTNQAQTALKTVQTMKWASDDAASPTTHPLIKDDRIVLFDVEVYPNLVVVCWKYRGDKEGTTLINPTPQDIEPLLSLKLMGFNNRRYDNHILYAIWMGYNTQQVYELSQKIIANNRNAMFAQAYELSYGDIWDFASKKQTLKKWQIELGIHHMELDLPWDQPVPEELWPKVTQYCMNDVDSTEAVLEDRWQDFVARQILAEISGLTVNDTTQKHTAKIVFGNDRNPQSEFVYTDLRKEFPGYEFELGVSSYRGESPGEGGYVYAEPGLYRDVALLDVASMHPTSIEQLNLFGPYTSNFSALKTARLAIKAKDYETARSVLGGKLQPFLGDAESNPDAAEALSYALKIVINIVYGLTSASFTNPFKDPRNIDNIVAKRGALFMIDLKHFVQEQGFQVAHIKTDSIKIPNATFEIIEEVTKFGAKYGYTFEHEATYEKFALVNDAVYIARYADGHKKAGKWEAVGAQFQHPYVYKTLFSGEEIGLSDLMEPKSVVQGAMYLDFDHDTPMATATGDMKFIGRTGLFVPVKQGGGVLYRVKDDKTYAVTGTKGYLWVEAEMFNQMPDHFEIDMTYFEHLAAEAQAAIGKYGNFKEFIS